MAIAQTGSIATYDVSGSNSGTASSTITVPGDATLVLVGISGVRTDLANFFSGGGMTFTKAGSGTAMTPIATGGSAGDADNTKFQSAMFYLTNPDTGTNKTLTYDWSGSGNDSGYGVMLSVIFFKGVDTGSPVRSTGADQEWGPPFTTGTMTAQTGDLIVAWVGVFSTGQSNGTADSWSNLSLISQVTNILYADGAWASGSPTGSTSVELSTATNWEDGSISAVVLKPAADATVQGLSLISGISSITI